MSTDDYSDGASTTKSEIGGVNVVFQDLSYSVPVKEAENGTFQILHLMNGSFLPGKMTALMGPSGSGKSTLLDVLSGRKNAGTTEGSVLLNGMKPSSKDLKRLVGYVEQFDTLVGELTVEQMLSYTASLKLPASLSLEERQERVEEVITKLDLGSCRNTIIGSSLMRGISGGQAKRVNIGLAMITRPRILFLDEPTSGLDSRTADEVIELLRELAHEGRAIVCTIHSPTGHAFAQFDDLHMLHQGKTIYDGPLSSVQSYFEGLGYNRDPDCSLPEWLVDLTSDMPRKLETKDLIGVEEVTENNEATTISKDKKFAELFEKSELIKAAAERRESMAMKKIPIDKDDAPPSEFSKLITLLKFRMVAHYKDGQFLGTRFGDKIVFALLILSLYWGIGDKEDPQSITSTSSLLYFICAICGYGAAAFVPGLTLERSLYYRELADGCYKPGTYYMAKFVEEGVLATITSLIFCIIVHFGCSFQGNFLVFTVSYYLTTMMGIIMAYAVAASVPSMEAANAILPLIVTIWMYFGGLFINFNKIPKGWYWFSWTSFLRYAWGSMMLNQYQDSSLGDIVVFLGDDGEGFTILDFYGLEGSIMGSIGACIGLLAVLIGIFAAIGVLALTLIRHDKR
mmetsp:Transcript_9473/g.13446  ORF Transcript_9473/g.13446 Transcript_9473/m.13446 type:complete len:626 (+) Transcript_9473:183-2060(+)